MQIKRLIRKTFDRCGYEIKRVKPYVIQPWESNTKFKDMMSKVYGYSLVDPVRCYMIYQFSKQACRVSGDIAEVGVYKGGTARILSKVSEPYVKTLHLFDTFEGMPPCDSERDLHKEGDFSDTSLDVVKKYLLDCPNILFYRGLFPGTALTIKEKRFCFVHIDVDIYKSILDCCVFFYTRMEKGGIMIFDDYGSLSCPGAKMAVDEFFFDKPEKPSYLPTGQCFVNCF